MTALVTPVVRLSARLAAREHLAWCVCRGMTANDVCESVGAFLDGPSWRDAQDVLEVRWMQMQAGSRMPFMSDRRAA